MDEQKKQESQEKQEKQGKQEKQRKRLSRRNIRIIQAAVFLLAVIVVGFIVFGDSIANRPKLDYEYGTSTVFGPTYPDAAFAVISDLHLYDASLGSAGEAFEEVKRSDRKLLLESMDLLDLAIEQILVSNAEFLLVSGDLTKDGELINHRLVAEKLAVLNEAGIKVYVTPGNHDVNNPEAFSFSGREKTPVQSVSPEEFAEIYADFGYGEALSRDTNSLSYLAEPIPGLWLLSIDACRYRENKTGQALINSGKISQATLNWITGILKEAQQRGIPVMAMMHHGVVEHWEGQAKLHPDYLIEDYRYFGRFLASYDVRLVFTGHYHAQDVTQGIFTGGKYIYDVETGSLVTPPCPIRYCFLFFGPFSADSVFIVDELYPETDFAENSRAFVKELIMLEARNILKEYNVSDADADIIADAVGDAFVAHYNGEEDPSERLPLDESRLSLWGRIVLSTQRYVLEGLWKDLEPADNSVTLGLE
ncbi:MAG: metallophosphoesterase [Lachnospiraceae bacterium]|jgi:3',5'-cyclic AMP phosphodiesterase CpdA|nr:metallophosphoesterase [Lachnospiraceae bacterium]